jgi:hypothetical protein
VGLTVSWIGRKWDRPRLSQARRHFVIVDITGVLSTSQTNLTPAQVLRSPVPHSSLCLRTRMRVHTPRALSPSARRALAVPSLAAGMDQWRREGRMHRACTHTARRSDTTYTTRLCEYLEYLEYHRGKPTVQREFARPPSDPLAACKTLTEAGQRTRVWLHRTAPHRTAPHRTAPHTDASHGGRSHRSSSPVAGPQQRRRVCLAQQPLPCMCVRACVRACYVRACVRACVRVYHVPCFMCSDSVGRIDPAWAHGSGGAFQARAH